MRKRQSSFNSIRRAALNNTRPSAQKLKNSLKKSLLNGLSVFSLVFVSALGILSVVAYSNSNESELVDFASDAVIDRQQLWPIVLAASKESSVDPELLWAVIAVESNFDHRAVSPVGARGLMQLMPHTARELNIVDPFNPRENVHGGAKYLQQMLKRFKGNYRLALAAYNAGPANVRKYQGIPPYRETQNYVSKVLKAYQSNIKNSPLGPM